MNVFELAIPVVFFFENLAGLEYAFLNAYGLIGGVGQNLCANGFAFGSDNANVCEGPTRARELSANFLRNLISLRHGQQEKKFTDPPTSTPNRYPGAIVGGVER